MSKHTHKDSENASERETKEHLKHKRKREREIHRERTQRPNTSQSKTHNTYVVKTLKYGQEIAIFVKGEVGLALIM